jgi:hypothetical protein
MLEVSFLIRFISLFRNEINYLHLLATGLRTIQFLFISDLYELVCEKDSRSVSNMECESTAVMDGIIR